MSGFVAAVAERNVASILLEGLTRIEYQGYDSSGMAVLQRFARENERKRVEIQRISSLGKVSELSSKLSRIPQYLRGMTGMAYSGWSSVQVDENSILPFISHKSIGIVKNGAIDNIDVLQQKLVKLGYSIGTETDAELLAHLIYESLEASNLDEKTPEAFQLAVRHAVHDLEGEFALSVMSTEIENALIAYRQGSYLTIGVGFEEYFVATETAALEPVTQRFVVLEDFDLAIIQPHQLTIRDKYGYAIERDQSAPSKSALSGHRHFLHKEIFEQPQAIDDTLNGRIKHGVLSEETFGRELNAMFTTLKRVHLVGSSSSFHAALLAKVWMQEIMNLPILVSYASEFDASKEHLLQDSLVVFISESGETPKIIEQVKQLNKLRQQQHHLNINTLAICNNSRSQLVRYSDYAFLTHAGVEVSLTSTKAMTTQLVALALLNISMAKSRGLLSVTKEQTVILSLLELSTLVDGILRNEGSLQGLAKLVAMEQHLLIVAPSKLYPLAQEAAWKLKQLSYMHAEALLLEELEAGPIALLDERMPVLLLASKEWMTPELEGCLERLANTGAPVMVLQDQKLSLGFEKGVELSSASTNMGVVNTPIVFNVALQLFAYHCARYRGTDIDLPRHLLAKR